VLLTSDHSEVEKQLLYLGLKLTSYGLKCCAESHHPLPSLPKNTPAARRSCHAATSTNKKNRVAAFMGCGDFELSHFFFPVLNRRKWNKPVATGM